MPRKILNYPLSILASMLVVLLCITGCQCSTKEANTSQAKSQTPEDQLVNRGKTIYAANCTSCHNTNPKSPGSLGPEIAGSSKELLTTRIMNASYPDGYTPKRLSKAMPAMPHLANEIDALYAFLNKP